MMAPTQSTAAVDQRPRCWRCDRVLIEYAARPWQVKCSRCGAKNQRES